MADVYIVVLDVTAEAVRALLFDSSARRVEGYSAQLPRRADAADGLKVDCLDEMHRLVEASGFRVGAVMGRTESEVTAEDRKFWPALAGAAWFAGLPEGAGMMLGCGCVRPDFLFLTLGMMGTLVESQVSVAGLDCLPIDDKRWFLSGAVPEADAAYSSLRRAIKGSVEQHLEEAAAGDPLVEALDSALRGFRGVYQRLSRLHAASQVIACGPALLHSPSLAQRIANGAGVSLTVSTEPEPGCRGSALWALEQIGAIGDMRELPASLGPVIPLKDAVGC